MNGNIIARIRAIVNKIISFYNIAMIVYDKLWETMKLKGVSQYKLIKQFGVSTGQLDRLRKNENVSTYTLNKLCTALHCRLEDIAEFIE